MPGTLGFIFWSQVRSQYVDAIRNSTLNLFQGWDPADYGGAQTFVGVVYSYELDLAGYLPVQDLKRPLVSQLDPDFQALGQEGRLARVDSFNEARALSHALSSIGLSLDKIRKPEDLLARPLRQNELRIKHGQETSTHQLQASFFFLTIRQLHGLVEQPPSSPIVSTPAATFTHCHISCQRNIQEKDDDESDAASEELDKMKITRQNLAMQIIGRLVTVTGRYMAAA